MMRHPLLSRPTALAGSSLLLMALAVPAAAGAATTELVSIGSTGKQGNSDSGQPSVSGDGGRVAFASNATDLVTVKGFRPVTNILVRDRRAGTTAMVDVNSRGVAANDASTGPLISR